MTSKTRKTCLSSKDFDALKRKIERLAPSARTAMVESLLGDHPERESMADAVLQRAYRDEVRSISLNARQCIKSGEITDREGLIEWIEQICDGHNDVIYTWYARKLLVTTENPNAYEEEIGEKPPTVEAAAMFALRADVIEQLRVEGVDVNDEASEWMPDEG